jgi:hypothetical protein
VNIKNSCLRRGLEGEGEVPTASPPRALDHSSASMSSSLDPDFSLRTLYPNRSHTTQGVTPPKHTEAPSSRKLSFNIKLDSARMPSSPGLNISAYTGSPGTYRKKAAQGEQEKGNFCSEFSTKADTSTDPSLHDITLRSVRFTNAFSLRIRTHQVSTVTNAGRLRGGAEILSRWRWRTSSASAPAPLPSSLDSSLHLPLLEPRFLVPNTFFLVAESRWSKGTLALS